MLLVQNTTKCEWLWVCMPVSMFFFFLHLCLSRKIRNSLIVQIAINKLSTPLCNDQDGGIWQSACGWTLIENTVRNSYPFLIMKLLYLSISSTEQTGHAFYTRLKSSNVQRYDRVLHLTSSTALNKFTTLPPSETPAVFAPIHWSLNSNYIVMHCHCHFVKSASSPKEALSLKTLSKSCKEIETT